MSETNTDPEVTEMSDISVERVDGVKSAANGFPILMLKAVAPTHTNVNMSPGCGCCEHCSMPATKALTEDERAEVDKALEQMRKAVNENGERDEHPDISTAEHVLVLLAKLIQAEAAEMATGEWDESCDISLLNEAVSCMKWFLRNEQEGMTEKSSAESLDAFEDVAKAEEEALAESGEGVEKRNVSAAERKRLAGEGKALPDGSYPIDNASDLKNAAILARSGHGNVAAAKRLIARRAKELGVRNPLEDHSGSHEKSSPDQGATEKALAERLEKSEAEATALRERIGTLEAQIAKVLDTPIPGGPLITAPASARKQRDEVEKQVQAARYRRLSESTSDPDLKSFYSELARKMSKEEIQA